MTIQEQLIAAAKAISEKRGGEYVDVAASGTSCGFQSLYAHYGEGLSRVDAGTIEELIAAVPPAETAEEKAAKLRERANAMLAEAQKLEGCEA